MNEIKDKIENFLRRYGAEYMYPGIRPFSFLIVILLSGIVCGAIGFMINPYISAVTFIAGLCIPVLVIVISNSSDNDAMLADIESIYDIIRIQARAGIFVQDSLMDCYMMTCSKRLKSALLELCNRISTKCTMEEAVSEFNKKFANRHIDILCIVLNQAQTSGKTVQILSDMSEQIRQVRHAYSLKEKSRLERRIEVIELLIFIGVIAIGIYSMGTEITRLLNE